jgi:hypothetical protein
LQDAYLVPDFLQGQAQIIASLNDLVEHVRLRPADGKEVVIKMKANRE